MKYIFGPFCAACWCGEPPLYKLFWRMLPEYSNDHLRWGLSSSLGISSSPVHGQRSQSSAYNSRLKAWFQGVFNIVGLGSVPILPRLFWSTLEYLKSKIAEGSNGTTACSAKTENEGTIVAHCRGGLLEMWENLLYIIIRFTKGSTGYCKE